MTDETTHAYGIGELVWFEDPRYHDVDYIRGVIVAHRPAHEEYDVRDEATGEVVVQHGVLMVEREAGE